ncbi:hypothetical protein ACP70R_007637 [Stipagrostis hirtigluma subsp. patula]
MTRCATKNVETAGSDSAEESAVAAGGVPEADKHAAADAAMAAAAGVDTTAGEEGAPTRLSQAYVDGILACKVRPMVAGVEDPDEYYERMTNDPLKCFSQEYIEQSTEILHHLAEESKRSAAAFEEF